MRYAALNPFANLRYRLEMDIPDLAGYIGVSVGAIEAAETGAALYPKAYADALEAAGVIDDAQAILTQHLSWMAELRAAMAGKAVSV